MIMAKDGIWTEFSPFKGKSAQDLDATFREKGFRANGQNPIVGRGSYVKISNERRYHIDPQNAGKYREPNHVDVHRPPNYNGPLPKKKFGYLAEGE